MAGVIEGHIHLGTCATPPVKNDLRGQCTYTVGVDGTKSKLQATNIFETADMAYFCYQISPH